MRSSTLPSIAIVVAGLLIAAGLFFGRRAEQTPAAPVAAVVSVVPAPVAPPRPVASRSQVAAHAAEALAYFRPRLLSRCYLPAVTGDARPPVELVFDVTFDAEGTQVMRGTVERRDMAIEAVTRCVADELPLLRIPAPGAVTMVEVTLRFP